MVANTVTIFTELRKMVAADFEKDDDSNGHIDFIAAAAVSIIYNEIVI